MNKNEWNERMFDAMLKLALEENLEQELKEIEATSADNPIIPSKRFERRMEYLLQKHTGRIRVKKTLKTLGRVAAVFLILMGSMFSLLMSAQAVRDQVFRTITEWGNVFVGFRFEETGTKSEDAALRPTYIPEGFTESNEYLLANMTSVEYTGGEDGLICFDEIIKDSGLVTQIDNEHSTMRVETIEGFNVQIYDSSAYGERYASYIVWETEKELYMISGNYAVDELLKMAKSIIMQIAQK